MIIFLNEGFRSFYKIIYAVCILLKDKLLQERDPKKIPGIFLNSNLDMDID